jgi:hypothetical protein
VIKRSKIRRQTVALPSSAPRPSRIRREPVPVDNAMTRKLERIAWRSREWEIRLAIAGIIFFALALSAVVIDIGEVLSQAQ